MDINIHEGIGALESYDLPSREETRSGLYPSQPL